MVDALDAIKILGSLLGKQGGASKSGGDILGNILKGALGGGGGSGGSADAGGGGDLLGGLLGMAMKQFGQQAEKQQTPVSQKNFQPNFDEVEPEPKIDRNQANDQATVLIKAMINAAKSDGKVDKEEVEVILKQLGEVSQAEINFVRAEIAQPLDVEAFARSVPRGLEQNVYAVSLIAMDLDSNPEARYLHQLAQNLEISPQLANKIHEKVGAPQIYT